MRLAPVLGGLTSLPDALSPLMVDVDDVLTAAEQESELDECERCGAVDRSLDEAEDGWALCGRCRAVA